MYCGIASVFFDTHSLLGMVKASPQTPMLERTAYAEPAVGRPINIDKSTIIEKLCQTPNGRFPTAADF